MIYDRVDIMLRKRFRKYTAIILLLCIFGCQIQKNALENVSAIEYTGSAIVVKEIDLGDYQSQMVVGERQLLDITILPVEAADQNIAYSSSDTSVAKINGLGRITALKAGVTEIAVSCGGITEKFGLTVSDTQSVRDLDLGDCPSEIEVGTSQVLNVTVIPEDASSEKILYQTSDASIAIVNEIGRVTGIKEGNVTITITCGNVKKGLSINIISAQSDEIAVTDIEIADYEEELEVDKTMTLSATVIPSNATDTTVTYESSDERIATVSSSGEVKGIAEGVVTISVSAGTVTKKIELKVKVATRKIELDTTYLVLRQGESHQLSARAIPAEADQVIVFETNTPDIVSVSGTGLVTAKECGTGEIIVKNGDVSAAVTVIVNLTGGDENQEQKQENQQDNVQYENEMYVEDCLLVTADMLKYFYTRNENLTVYGNGYVIKIVGNQIKNWENELYTNIEIKREKQGIAFDLNRCKKICGPVTIQFDENVVSGKYVYLYNTSKGKYELLKGQDTAALQLDTEGSYLITKKKLPDGKGSIVVLIVAGIVVIIMLGVYIAVKKQYWFW